jgi:uncharacterized protein YaaW (UPF0174 family)
VHVPAKAVETSQSALQTMLERSFKNWAQPEQDRLGKDYISNSVMPFLQDNIFASKLLLWTSLQKLSASDDRLKMETQQKALDMLEGQKLIAALQKMTVAKLSDDIAQLQEFVRQVRLRRPQPEVNAAHWFEFGYFDAAPILKFTPLVKSRNLLQAPS